MSTQDERGLDGGWAGIAASEGHILLADITGYTAYLSSSELAHAQNVVADLADVIVGGLRPVFHKSKLEGDAVLAYAMAETVDGSIVLDVVEETYFAFRKRVRDVDLATTCECNACRLIPSLDLKFVVHYGDFVLSEMAGSQELTGADVILAHRLLKNTVREDLGFHAYALLTEACIDALGMNPTTIGLVEHTDTYETVGDVHSYVENLTERWQFEEERRQVFVTPANAQFEETWQMEAPVDVVWEYMTSPEKRLLWRTDIDSIDQNNPSGRVGAGTTNHCKHGKGVLIEEILDWKPFRYFTLKGTLPMLGEWTVTYEFHERAEGESEMQMRIERLRGVRKLTWQAMRPVLMRRLDRSMEQLANVVAAL